MKRVDVFLDMTGTITDMESENLAMLKLAERIKRRFSLDMSAEEIAKKIDEFRKPFMERRDVEYVPIRYLVLEAVKNIVPKRLCTEESYWILDEYTKVHGEYVRLAPGAKEGLRRIRERAEHMGIITDGDRPYTEKLLESLGISDIFDSITTAEDAGVGKPNIKIFQMALKNSKSDVKFYIGDSESRDMKGGKSTGMRTIKIGDWTKYGDYTARDLVEASKIIEKYLR